MLNLDEIDEMYRDYKLLKKAGHFEYLAEGRRIYIPPKYRNITAPNDELKAEQKRILKQILNKIKLNNRASGFVPGKDIVSNATEHLGAKWILEIDMKEFFDTITKDQVKTALINNHIDEEQAEYISIVCTRNGTTPQGAPTSPYLSNIVCKPLDRKVKEMAIRYNCVYTRYADDITISSKDGVDGYNILQSIKPELESLVHSAGFKINKSKTQVVGGHNQQKVTGVVINASFDEVYAPKKERLEFRATLHTILKDIHAKKITSLDELETNYKSYPSLQGYANFLYQANPKQCEKYVNQVKEIHCLLRGA